MTREASVEAYFVRRVAERGGEQRKVKWIGRNGAPDRFVMLPGVGHGVWVELKSPDTILRFPANAHERMQAREHELMRSFGERVFVLGTRAQIDTFLEQENGN